MLDPRFNDLQLHLNVAMNAALAGDEQLVAENLYHLREIAWSINSDIFAKRWAARPRHSIPRSNRATVDDLLL
jgi:hypothetical protein